MKSLKEISTERLELLVKQKRTNFRKETNAKGEVTLDNTSQFELYSKLIRDAYLYSVGKRDLPYETLGDLVDYLIQEELLQRYIKQNNNVPKSTH